MTNEFAAPFHIRYTEVWHKSNLRWLLFNLEDLIDRGLAPVRQKRKDSFDVFLSYRGTHTQAAQRLVDESLQEHGEAPRSSALTTCRILMK